MDKNVEFEAFLSQMLSAIGKTIEEELANLLKKENLSVAVAESLTGGLISERLTSRPGASDYFIGGLVCYSNRIKVLSLGIPAQLIAKEGPVSQEVAQLMAENIKKQFKTSIGLSATGVAGPDITSPPKPIGLTYIAVSSDKGNEFKELMLSGTRKEIREKAAQAALGLLWIHLSGETL